MKPLQTTLTVCLIVLPAATVSPGQGGSMSDGPALIIAAERNDTATVRQLLKAGANLHTRDAQGRTALLEAIILADGGSSHREIVRLLVHAGANVNLPDVEGVTPLQHARQKGLKDIADRLESAGAR